MKSSLARLLSGRTRRQEMIASWEGREGWRGVAAERQKRREQKKAAAEPIVGRVERRKGYDRRNYMRAGEGFDSEFVRDRKRVGAAKLELDRAVDNANHAKIQLDNFVQAHGGHGKRGGMDRRKKQWVNRPQAFFLGMLTATGAIYGAYEAMGTEKKERYWNRKYGHRRSRGPGHDKPKGYSFGKSFRRMVK